MGRGATWPRTVRPSPTIWSMWPNSWRQRSGFLSTCCTVNDNGRPDSTASRRMRASSAAANSSSAVR
jgi:hypothetical protein